MTHLALVNRVVSDLTWHCAVTLLKIVYFALTLCIGMYGR